MRSDALLARLGPRYIGYVLLVSLTASGSYAATKQYDVFGARGYFEWDCNRDGVADGWYFGKWNNPDATASLATSGFRGWGKAQRLMLVSHGSNTLTWLDSGVRVGPGEVITAGDTLRVGLDVYPVLYPGTRVFIYTHCYGANGDPLQTLPIVPVSRSSRSTWLRGDVTFQVPAGTTEVDVEIKMYGSGMSNGRLMVDNVTITKDVETIPTPVAGSVPAAVFPRPAADAVYTAKRCGAFIGGDLNYGYDIRTFNLYNPEAVTFRYEIAAATVDAPWVAQDDQLGYYWISANHPEWILRDASGQETRFIGYPGVVGIDPGNPDYQRIWAQNAVRNARMAGANGIFIDNVNSFYDWAFAVKPLNYPDNQSYAAAMDSFLRYVIPEIRKAGLMVIANGATETWGTSYWEDWLGLMDGRSYEPPGRPDSTHPESEQLWRDIKAGYDLYPSKFYVHFTVEPQTSPGLFLFEVASFLLWKGPSSFLGMSCHGEPLPVHPLLDAPFGDPIEKCIQVGNTAYRRAYRNGVVFLNISATNSQTVSVPTKLKDAMTGEMVKPGPRTLAPHESLFLIK